jgi:hypothetical protein
LPFEDTWRRNNVIIKQRDLDEEKDTVEGMPSSK